LWSWFATFTLHGGIDVLRAAVRFFLRLNREEAVAMWRFPSEEV
jgi:hypothetical protein